MTLVVALRWGQGVLVTSDARVSSGPLIYEEQKIFKISLPAKTGEEIDLAVMAGAGDAALIKQGYAIIGEEFKKWLDKQPSEIVYPSAEDIANIVNSIQSRLLERFCELRKFGVEPNCSLLLAVITRDGQPLLYTFDEGLAQLRQHGFALLGRGEVTGGLLLLKLLGYSPGMELADAGLLSMFIIDMVSQVDPSVSPFTHPECSVYIRYESGKVVIGSLTEKAFIEYKSRIEKLKLILSGVWKIAEEGAEQELLATLNRLKKRLGVD